jgi:hypothetical protein
MGMDIYLTSIWEPWLKAFEDSAAHRKLQQDCSAQGDPESIMAAADRVFEVFAASGGYFRNGYNGGDVMWAMGLSWHSTVQPMLDAEERLPIAKARELLAMVEARPLTQEILAQHYLANMTNGVESHPLTGQIFESIRAEAAGEQPAPLLPPDFEHLAQFLRKSREQLLAILRKSIELNEPLLCDG